MSNDKSCVNHDRRKFKVFCEPVVDADRIGALHGRTSVPWMDRVVVTRARFEGGVDWITPALKLPPGKAPHRTPLFGGSITVPQTDTGEQVYTTQANERPTLKELGKLVQ
jgi:hypothetical protein